MKKLTRLCVLVDSQLPGMYGAVQGMHAVGQFMLEHGIEKWPNEVIIVKKTHDLKKYLHLADSIFREPDLNNQITAIAGMNLEKHVKHLPLM